MINATGISNDFLVAFGFSEINEKLFL